jgi:branched-chain amino acid transport system ATP-binding protein
MMILEIEQLGVRFGGLVAIDDLELSVESGTIHALIGPNGAGKTTVINVITGLYPVSTGTIRFGGRDILGLRPDQVCRAGIARTFQNTELFGEMTVVDNVRVGAHCREHSFLFGNNRSAVAHVERLLDVLGLLRERNVTAGTLPFAKQRRLELARALATSPRLLLLDEPAAGLRANEIGELNRTLVRLRDEHRLTILLVDHVMQVVMNISDRVSVLNFGRKIAEGPAEAVRNEPEVKRAYLGENRRARTS